MNRDEEFEKWYDEYFGNAQGEDSPYTYNDVKIAFFKGFKTAKENLTKHNSRTIQSVKDLGGITLKPSNEGNIIADKQNPQIDDRPCKVCHNKLTQHSRFYDNHTYEPAD